MSVAWPNLPTAYRGVWKRTLYAEPSAPPHTQLDTTTQVIWLQTSSWHADLRLPAERPDFTGVSGLAGCSREQLIWLASLTAFAGLTQVEGELCSWHRLADLAPSLERDVGAMRFLDTNALEERHPYGHYLEHWERLASTGEEHLILNDRGLPTWMQLGDHAIAIVHRPSGPGVEALFTPPERLDDDTLRWRASLRLDYLCRETDGWRVTLSTHPWREELTCRHSVLTEGHAS
ncbi:MULTISPECIES: hypothetical protein [Halomonadaceae]|uniref:hypothetical protein n=1 Tax=Halomonadaceae TaxID=28256 RepID=UPI001597272A|nr:MULTISPECIES: hypothetical protein [Halomonas]QJQ95899.1 hypothetical protein HIO72_11900 [Halomonas sp. PA5]